MRWWVPIVCVVSGGGAQRLRRQFVHQIILVERLLHKFFFLAFFSLLRLSFFARLHFLISFRLNPIVVHSSYLRASVENECTQETEVCYDDGRIWVAAHSLCRLRAHFILKIDSSSSHSSLSLQPLTQSLCFGHKIKNDFSFVILLIVRMFLFISFFFFFCKFHIH